MDLLPQTTTIHSNKSVWMTWADWTGLAASIACGIHCAAMPLLLSYLPSFGLSWLAHEGFHQWMTVACFIFAASAFVPGWRKHKSLVPAFSGVIGITLLSLSAFVFGDECCAAATGSQLNAACTDAACTMPPVPMPPVPMLPVPMLPVPMLPVPMLPVPMLPVPMLPVPMLPVPMLPVPMLPVPMLPVPMLPAVSKRAVKPWTSRKGFNLHRLRTG